MLKDSVTELQPSKTSCDRPKKILIIDDDESQVAALAYRLGQQGFRVLTAMSGSEAVFRATTERPNLILLDLRLPDMEGFELGSKLADAPETCGIPIIILSALERPDIVRRARAMGCDYYIRKPYDPNALLTLIQTSLENADRLDW